MRKSTIVATLDRIDIRHTLIQAVVHIPQIYKYDVASYGEPTQALRPIFSRDPSLRRSPGPEIYHASPRLRPSRRDQRTLIHVQYSKRHTLPDRWSGRFFMNSIPRCGGEFPDYDFLRFRNLRGEF